MRCFDGNYPVIGSWIIGDEACGIGIREDATMITRNSSRFVPHAII
jgi:glutathionylspermidine synthase